MGMFKDYAVAVAEAVAPRPFTSHYGPVAEMLDESDRNAERCDVCHMFTTEDDVVVACDADGYVDFVACPVCAGLKK